MNRYILLAFAFALGWLCLESGQALTAYTDADKISDVPLIGRDAHVGYKIVYDTATGNVYVYQNVKNPIECQVLCQQWGTCAIWIWENSQQCTLVQRSGFQKQETTKLRISGDDECARDDGCLKNGQFYHGVSPVATKTNVEDPFKCQDECADQKGCSHYVWSMAKGKEDYCWLHTGNFGQIKTGTQVHNGDKAVNFVSGSIFCDTCLGFHLETLYLKRIVFPDGSVMIKVDSYLKCQKHCKDHPLCRWFEWLTNDQNCYLFHPWSSLVAAAANTVVAFRNADLKCSNCTGNGLNDPSVTTCDLAGNCLCKANYADKWCKDCQKGYNKDPNGACIKSG